MDALRSIDVVISTFHPFNQTVPAAVITATKEAAVRRVHPVRANKCRPSGDHEGDLAAAVDKAKPLQSIRALIGLTPMKTHREV